MSSRPPSMSGLESPCGPVMEQLRRVVSVVVIVPPLVLFLAYASQGLFFLLICIVMGMSLNEYFRLLALKQPSVGVSLSYAMALSLALTAYIGGVRWMPLALSLSIVALTANVMWTAGPASPSFPALLHSLFGLLFVGWGLSHLVLLRGLEAGTGYLLLLCAVIWTGDVTALYVGKGLGRHYMAPSISPGKTWEGAAGGVLSCLLVAAMGARFLAPQLSLLQGLVLGLVLSCVAQVSDLGESMLKRYVGVKDSGALIPGHGGMLDRIDSLFFAAPLAFYTLDFMTAGSAS